MLVFVESSQRVGLNRYGAPVGSFQVVGEVGVAPSRDLAALLATGGSWYTGVEQHQQVDPSVGGGELTRHLVGDGPTERPAAEEVGTVGPDVADHPDVAGRALGDAYAVGEAFQSVDGLPGPEQLGQIPVYARRATGGVDEEQRRTIVAVLEDAQARGRRHGVNVVLAYHVGDTLDGRCREQLVGVDPDAGLGFETLVDPVELGRGGTERGEIVEHTDGGGVEGLLDDACGEALGGVTRLDGASGGGTAGSVPLRLLVAGGVETEQPGQESLGVGKRLTGENVLGGEGDAEVVFDDAPDTDGGQRVEAVLDEGVAGSIVSGAQPRTPATLSRNRCARGGKRHPPVQVGIGGGLVQSPRAARLRGEDPPQIGVGDVGDEPVVEETGGVHDTA